MFSVSSSTGQTSDRTIESMRPQQSPPASSRILDIPCKVCGDFSSGKHYNIFACDGCAGFFKRSIRRNRQYVCKAKVENGCKIDKTNRNQCRACRLRKCEAVGMNKDAVQHERGPRNSTLRKQAMVPYYTEESERIMAAGPLGLPLPQLPMLHPSYSAMYPHQYMLSPPKQIPLPVHHLLPMPDMRDETLICENAARLLFLNVQWLKNNRAFLSLLPGDQRILIQDNWKDLFILSIAQYIAHVDISMLVRTSNVLEKHVAPTLFMNTIKDLQDVLTIIREYNMDHIEFSCIRAISTYKCGSPTAMRRLTDPRRVMALHDDAQATLASYIHHVYPGNQARLGRLLSLQNELDKVSGETIETLFFKKTIGHIPLVKLILDMFDAAPVSPPQL